jgi:hypothetical protein
MVKGLRDGRKAGDGKVVRAFLNGAQQSGNSGARMLGAHDEVAVLYGIARPDETISLKCDFHSSE